MSATASAIVFLLLSSSFGPSSTSSSSSATATSTTTDALTISDEINDLLYGKNIECLEGSLKMMPNHDAGAVERMVKSGKIVKTGCRQCTVSFTFKEDMNFMLPEINITFGCKENQEYPEAKNRECSLNSETCSYNFTCVRSNGCSRDIFNVFEKQPDSLHWSFMRCLGAQNQGVFKPPDDPLLNYRFIWITIAVIVSVSPAIGAKIWCTKMEAGKYRLLMEIEKEKRDLKELMEAPHPADTITVSPVKKTPTGSLSRSAKRNEKSIR